MADHDRTRFSVSCLRRDIILATVDMTTGAVLGYKHASVEQAVGSVQSGTVP